MILKETIRATTDEIQGVAAATEIASTLRLCTRRHSTHPSARHVMRTTSKEKATTLGAKTVPSNGTRIAAAVVEAVIGSIQANFRAAIRSIWSRGYSDSIGTLIDSR